MKYFIYTLSVGVLSFYILSYMTQTEIQKLAYDQLNYALKHAVHDAALQIDKSGLTEDLILFDEIKAESVFIETMQRNLPVDFSLQPKDTILYEQPIEVVDKIYIDDDFIDINTGIKVTFPFVYEYEDITKGLTFDQAIFGPSVIYVVKTKVYKGTKEVYQVVVQEYKK